MLSSQLSTYGSKEILKVQWGLFPSIHPSSKKIFYSRRDVSVIADVVTAILHNSKFRSGITPDAACCLIDKLL